MGNLLALIGGDLEFEQMRAVLERDGRKLVPCERDIAETALAGAYYVEPVAPSAAEPKLWESAGPASARLDRVSSEVATLRASLERLAMSPHLHVLIKGERGSGRRTVARELHDLTPGSGAWVELVDLTELATVVARDEPCTVYLGDLLRLSKAQQTKLYRALSSRRGGARRRFVGALGVEAPTAGGELCEWVVDRFSVTLRVPPLSERSAELPALVPRILASQARELGLATPELTPEAMEVLRRHRFPGNVRELENVLRTALVACKGTRIVASDLPIQQASDAAAFTLPSGGVDLDALERDIIRQAMRRTQGNRTRAASLLGLTRDQVRYRLSKIEESVDE
ncbi:MAG: two component, sigma54 specific, transcriptional regulator, Fis family [Polyangiaceae bacterium]|nr:two component, sigma54 specific, transcriptional regulator, Fis family [Polyangiaceae bacterium]